MRLWEMRFCLHGEGGTRQLPRYLPLLAFSHFRVIWILNTIKINSFVEVLNTKKNE